MLKIWKIIGPGLVFEIWKIYQKSHFSFAHSVGRMWDFSCSFICFKWAKESVLEHMFHSNPFGSFEPLTRVEGDKSFSFVRLEWAKECAYINHSRLIRPYTKNFQKFHSNLTL